MNELEEGIVPKPMTTANKRLLEDVFAMEEIKQDYIAQHPIDVTVPIPSLQQRWTKPPLTSCPYCSSTDVDWGLDSDESIIYIFKTALCSSCNKTWNMHYKYDGWSPIDD
jgi:hypothetical protein